MLAIFKKHYLILILALIAGTLTALPQILAIKKINNFQGIYKIANNDETYYLARGRDIIDGHSHLGNPYLFEHKNEQPVQFWLPDYILAKPLAIFNINIHYGYFFYDFIFPFALVLLTYYIIYLLTNEVSVSFLGTAFLHLNLFLYAFGRSPSPQLNFLFWLLLFLFWLKFLYQSNYKNAFIMGIFFGLLFHIYTYYWTFYIVFFVIYILVNIILKRHIEYKKYLLVTLIVFCFSIPYFISMLKSIGLPYYIESLTRIGMVNTHFPSGRKIFMWGFLTLILFFMAYKKKVIDINNKSLLLLSGILAAIITVNHHLITGKNLQFSSHYWMLSVFIFIFTLVYIINLLLEKIKYKKIKLVILVLVFLYIFYYPTTYAISIIEGDAISYSENSIKQQNYAPIFKWLNENTYPDEVVFANNELSGLIPVYTANNVFYFAMAGLHFMSDKEFQERFILNNYWHEYNEQYAIDNKFGIWGAYYQTKYDHEQSKNKIRKLFFIPPKEYIKIPQEKIDKFLELAKEIQSNDFESQLKKYRVDYLIWNKAADPDWKINDQKFLSLIIQVDDLAIYKVN